MTFELCTNCLEGAKIAEKSGMKRIELCSALQVGGLTPSFGLIKQCTTETNIEVHVMLRHQEGDFVYNDADVQIMMKDISAIKAAGATGVVFGCLTSSNEIDIDHTHRLAETARHFSLETTFHRAFDLCNNPIKAMEVLIELEINRILTSGQQTTAIEGIELIQELVQKAKGRIEIMVGSGVNASNAQVLSATGVNALHFSASKNNNEPTELGIGDKPVVDEEKIKSIVGLFEN